MQPVVTVLMPVRNEERYIRRAISCIQRQTFRGFEILVVDDGSTDRTPDLLAQIAAEDRRVRVLTTDGLGLSAVQNVGLQECRTEFVARLDADDMSLKRRLELQLAEFARNPSAVALGTYGYRVNEWGIPVGNLRTGASSPTEFHEWRAKGRPVNLTHSSAMYKRSAVEAVGGYPTDYRAAMDLALWTRLAEEGEVYALPRRQTLYTIRKTSVSSANLALQHTAAVRIRKEIQLGNVFNSFDDFRAYMESNEPAWPEIEHGIQAKADRRLFARSLANGQLAIAWRIAKDSPATRGIIEQTIRRVFRG